MIPFMKSEEVKLGYSGNKIRTIIASGGEERED